MIADLKAYPAYKDSSVPWLGDMPKHWELMPGRACYQEKKTPNKGMIESTVLSLSYGKIIVKPPEKLHGLVPESFETYQVINPNDIIIRSTDLQNDWNSLRFGISSHRGIITSAYMCFRTQTKLIPRFGHLLLHAYDLKKVFYGLGSGLRQNLDWRDFKYLPIPLPSPPEQAAIVRYLDHVDRNIHKYIRAKQKLIKLLEEQKQAIIHRAVTRGLDPNVPLKPSGVEWLGDVPINWQILPWTKYVSERADYRGATPEKVETGTFLITAKNVRFGWIDYDISKEYVRSDQYETIMRRGFPKTGDILITMEAPLGHAAIVDREDIALAQRLIRVRMNPEYFYSQYTLYSILSSYFQCQLLIRATGSTAQGIKAAKLPQLRILCPPLVEQKQIVKYILDETKLLNDAITVEEKDIDILREYRTRLIADVVTGKVDVREIASILPEMDESDILEEAVLDDEVIETDEAELSGEDDDADE